MQLCAESIELGVGCFALRLTEPARDRAKGDDEIVWRFTVHPPMLVWNGGRWQAVTSAPMFDGKFRVPIDKAVKPIGNGLRRTGLTPDHLTVMGLLVAVGAAVAIGAGWLRLGVLLVILAALPDLLDGALAKASNSSSQRGAFFDSTIDRFADALLFGGVAWYFANGAHPLMAMLPFAVMALSSVISYMRAKAESLGLDAKGGIMERAERIIALLLGLVYEPLLIPILWITLALTAITAVQRFVKVWKQAAVAPVTAERIELRRSRRESRRVVRTERRRTVISRATGRTSSRRD